MIGLFNTSNNGLRAFSGVTVGVVGGLIGIHWSLAISAMVLIGSDHRAVRLGDSQPGGGVVPQAN